MHIGVIGNFNVPFSTANDLRSELELMGHRVVACHETTRAAWQQIINAVMKRRVDAVLWNSTPAHAREAGVPIQKRLLKMGHMFDVPIVGVHLDRWWGLNRQIDVEAAPYFQVPFLYTADGAHDHEWERLGINHTWMPPAIATRNLGRGQFREEYASDIAFVGSHSAYHREHRHRLELIRFLKDSYGDRVALWPQNNVAIRGDDLKDLYASVKVVVGDSCLVPTTEGEPMHTYCSDRIFETLGRGGFLLHPHVEGITISSSYNGDDGLVYPGSHLDVWTLGNWDDLAKRIDHYLAADKERHAIATKGMEHVAANHTYAHRLEQIFKEVL